MAATPGARGVILRTAITDPRTTAPRKHLDQWLRARGIIASPASTPRADRADPQQGHAERGHRARQKWRVRPARNEGRSREWPASKAWTWCRW